MDYRKELGLTENEMKVYEVLLNHGKLGSGEISKLSGVPYGKIYVVLNSLISKRLVELVPEKFKKFAPSSPENLIDLIDKKKKILDEAKDKLEKLNEIYKNKEKNPVIVDYGIRGFHNLNNKTKPTKKYEYTIKFNSDLNPIWQGNIERKMKKGIDIKSLVRYDSNTRENVGEWVKIHKNIRKIENTGVALSIKDDDEVLISLINSNVSLMILDKAFAKIMKKLFLSNYEKAKKID